MSAMVSAIETWLLAYLLNSLWQAPLVFCTAWLAARLSRPTGPRMEHRVWVLALLLEVLLPMCAFRLESIWHSAWSLVLQMLNNGSANGVVRIVLGPARDSGVALPWLSPRLLIGVAVVYAGSVLYFAARLAWGVWKTESIRRGATAVELNEEWRSNIGELRIAASAQITAPAVLGLWRPALLVPAGFLEGLGAEELHALLGHELAHVRRHDFAKNLLYGLVSLPCAYHPLLWITRARLAETRELICDAVAADAAGGRGNYARCLLRLAVMLSAGVDRVESRIIHAVGIFDSNNFERRVMRLTEKQLPISFARRALIAAACLLVAFSTCFSALAWRMDVNAPEQKTVKRIAVAEKNMTLVHQVYPVYPEEAKKKKLNGDVVLALRVGKDGAVETIHVVKGPQIFQASALEAVKQWRYRPYLLNGNPIEVDTQVTVVFESKQ